MRPEQQQLLSAIREYYATTAYSHKIHEKQREIYSDVVWWVKWLNVILTTLTMVTVILSILLVSNWANVVSAIVAAITTLFAVYRLSFSPEDDVQAHRRTAKALLIHRQRLALLIERCMSPNANLDEIRKEYEVIVNEVGRIYAEAPETSSNAYVKAQNALKNNEELTFSVKEIDLFLPQELRLEKGSSVKAP